jgi:hypothetical protein
MQSAQVVSPLTVRIESLEGVRHLLKRSEAVIEVVIHEVDDSVRAINAESRGDVDQHERMSQLHIRIIGYRQE